MFTSDVFKIDSLLVIFCFGAFTWNSFAQTSANDVTSAVQIIPCRPGDTLACYQCKTNSLLTDDYCADPFNASHPYLAVVYCADVDHCSKWTVKLRSGAVQTIRTCASRMRLNLKVQTVCMTESGASLGSLCLCQQELCNKATTTTTTYPTMLLLAVIATVQAACRLRRQAAYQ